MKINNKTEKLLPAVLSKIMKRIGKIVVYGFGLYVLLVILFLVVMVTVSIFSGKFGELWAALMGV